MRTVCRGGGAAGLLVGYQEYVTRGVINSSRLRSRELKSKHSAFTPCTPAPSYSRDDTISWLNIRHIDPPPPSSILYYFHAHPGIFPIDCLCWSQTAVFKNWLYRLCLEPLLVRFFINISMQRELVFDIGFNDKDVTCIFNMQNHENLNVYLI